VVKHGFLQLLAAGLMGGGMTAAILLGTGAAGDGTTRTIVQSGTIFDAAATNPNYFFIPSILPSGQGHAAVAMSRSSTQWR